MTTLTPFVDPHVKFDQANPLREDAITYHSVTAQGKACRLIDNTGHALLEKECQEVLQSLIENDLFGFRCLSPQGGNALNLDRRESSHVQFGDNLYRLVVYHYEARIEVF